MKKLFLILLIFITNIVNADEYPSLHGGTFVQDILASQDFVAGNSYSKFWTYGISKASAKSATNTPYYPSGWNKFKVYVPAGLSLFRLNINTSPNASCRIHAKFRADADNTMDHSSAPGATIPIIQSSQTTFKIVIANTASLENAYESYFRSSTFPGGWLYIDIVADYANTYSENNLNPYLTIQYNIQIRDFNIFNNWLRNTPLLSTNGDPSAAVSSMIINDVATPDTITTRTISLDTGNIYYTGPLIGSATPTVTNFTPTRAIKNQSTLFTVTGEFLPSTLALSIDDATCTQSSYSETSVGFTCTPTASGAKHYTIKSETTGYTITSGLLSVTDTDPSATPITSVSPSFAITDQNTLFSISGNNLPSTLDFAITGADVCQVSGTPTATLVQFNCIPRVAGSKEYNVTTATAGNALYYGLLTVATPTITSFSPTYAYVNTNTAFTASGSNLPTTLSLEMDDTNCTRTSASAAGATFNCLATTTGTKTYRILTDVNGTLLSSGALSIATAPSSSSSGSGTCSNTCPTGFVLADDCTCNPTSSSSQGTSSSRSSSSTSTTCTGSTLPDPFGNVSSCAQQSSSSVSSSSSSKSSSSSSSSSDQNLTSQSMTLSPGWNLISIPIATNNTVDINKTISSSGATIAWKYNVQTDGNTSSASWEKWLQGGAMTLKSGESIFVGLPGTESKSITFSVKSDTNSTRFENTSFNKQTWYLIGYGYATTVGEIKTLYPDSVVWIWENGKYKKLEDNTTTIPAGQGFWFKNKAI